MVADLVLNETAQRALRDLMSAEPMDEGLAGAEELLITLSRLIPCDGIRLRICDGQGYTIDEVRLPRDWAEDGDAYVRPLPLGIAGCREALEVHGLADGLSVAFRSGRGNVVQVDFDRRTTPFGARDLQLLHMVTPTLDRLLRSPAPRLPSTLTAAERRVLQLVAAGLTNAEVASRIGVAPSTVRKHLEHAYRKLGVSNRLAAVVRLEGSLAAEPDRRERLTHIG